MDDANAPSRSPTPDWLVRMVTIHVAVLIVGLSWAFGGQSPGARHGLLFWGTAGVMLFMFVLRERANRATALRFLWPLLLFDALTLASVFNPSMREVMNSGAPYLVVTAPPHAWLPSSARPALTLRELWQFNGIVISCFNIFLLVAKRRQLRLLLAVIAGNALALAVFGTFQKIMGSPGLWFGMVPSPQPLFFATFIYHNHWGAFTLLNAGVWLALLFDTWRRGGHRDLWHSPLPMGVLGAVLLAMSIPLSASRSSTLLVSFLFFGALVHALARMVRTRRREGRSALPQVAAITLCVALALAAAGLLGRRVITERLQLTQDQIHTASGYSRLGTYEESYGASRRRLYADTWRMALARPYTGWGLETYGDVFLVYDTAPRRLHDQFRPTFREAHSDWLQSLAESGFIGTGLLVMLGLLPLLAPRWRKVSSPIPRYLLAGCGLVLTYAWVEFPFANPSVMVGFWSLLYVAARYAVLDQRAEARQTTP